VIPGLVALVLDVAAVPVLGASAYLAGLAALSRVPRERKTIPSTRFDIIVPAHDEERGILGTLASLSSIEYPAESFRVLVVADNCLDKTADKARSAGALVLERNDPALRGKGYALASGYDRSMADGFAEAVVVVDADSVVSPNILRQLSTRLADGEEALQAEYGVRNGGASWRTRLMVLAFALFHTVRSLGREKLGVSCGLRGNGMCFSIALLRRVPARAFSIVEDVEYGVALGLAGVRVGYVHAAKVLGDMPTSGAGSRSQRERWESGRWQLARKYAPNLARTGASRRDPLLLDLALDLIIPPLTWLACVAVVGTLLATAAVTRLGVSSTVIFPWVAALLGLGIYVARGIQLAGGGPRSILDLLMVPAYGVWKLTLLLRSERRHPDEWVRTTRPDAS
jgi:1,2-diacylglycerol 3-beta-glucosyltransferase